ncbi:hypothetical protein EG68_09221 [Paragonimus skrjabini miyazakii]|uniref:Uncharacterized protein n=1 Tax=Paragonimus skrjabini miyazakii TaxID=59628 RepID=A0A8S9YRI8_9TREM|nr:hypothetical protein EG68_09221 [Paragonimus skrjabini miyazakii]
MVCFIGVVISLALVQIVTSTLYCYRGTYPTPMKLHQLTIVPNCAYCSYHESRRKGRLTNVYYGCARNCKSFENRSEMQECCQTSLCNGKLAGNDPRKR